MNNYGEGYAQHLVCFFYRINSDPRNKRNCVSIITIIASYLTCRELPVEGLLILVQTLELQVSVAVTRN